MPNCKKCSTDFTIRDEDLKFYEKIDVPQPTHCSNCRLQRRLAWRNERKLYRRKCDATGEDVISNISDDKPFKVFKKDYWFSDKHNAIDHGRDFDFDKPFFEQFRELQETVPRFAIQQWEPMENSDYCNFVSNLKNSYFLFDSDYCEDSYYSNVLKNSNDCCDCTFTSKSELCYETVNCKDCYDMKYSKNCINCSNSIFLANCIGCKDCAFSINLRNKQYYFANKKYSKEEYEAKIEQYKLDKYSNLKKSSEFFEEQSTKQPHKFMQGTQNENVHGDYIYNSKNVYQSFNVEECWDIAYCDLLYRARDCYDVSSFGEKIELIYETTTVGLDTQNCKFCFTAVQSCNDLTYCDTAYSSKNSFGCVGLNRNEYCILNKQYSKEEYEELVPKIIEHMKNSGEWGEFFPMELSPFNYNETVANEFFPKEDEPVIAVKDAKKEIKASDLPDTGISEVPDEILDWAITCEESGRPFKLQPKELSFYKKTNLPVPHLHPDVRHKHRMAKINERRLLNRKCDNCSAEVETTFSIDRPEKVFCEKCYLDNTE